MPGEPPFTIHDHPTLLAQLRALGPLLWGSDEVAEFEIARIQSVPRTPFSKRYIGLPLRARSTGYLVISNPARAGTMSTTSPLADADVQAVDGWINTANTIAQKRAGSHPPPGIHIAKRSIITPEDLTEEERWKHLPAVLDTYGRRGFWNRRHTPFAIVEMGVLNPREAPPEGAQPMDLFVGLHFAYTLLRSDSLGNRITHLVLTGTSFHKEGGTWPIVLQLKRDGVIELSCAHEPLPPKTTLHPFFYPVPYEDSEDIHL